MKKFDIVPFKKTHAIDILEKNVDNDFVSEIDEVFFKWVDDISQHPAYTVFCDDIPIFSGGVVLLQWGMGDAWLLTQKEAFNYKKTLCSIVATKLNDIIESNNLLRISMFVDITNEKAKRFAIFLGFDNEGIVKKYGPFKKDYFQFARII